MKKEERHVSSTSDKWAYVAGTEKEPENRYGRPGASINAFAPSKTPPYDFSFLSHAAYGVQSYPNYLSKWNDKDIDELLRVLKNLERIAIKEKTVRNLREPFLEKYQLRTKTLGKLRKEDLAPGVVKLLELEENLKNVDLRKLLDVKCEYPGVYSFQLFRDDLCTSLVEEIRNFLKFRNEIEKTKGPILGTLRERLVLKDMKLDSFSSDVFQKVVIPLSKQVFDKHTSDLDFQHSYFVGYAPNECPTRNLIRNALIPHSDDSEITLNVCLSDGYTGGELNFHGAVSKDEFPTGVAPKVEYTYKHRLGCCVLHLGKQIHSVSSVTQGERHVLIMWCRSIRNQRAIQCPCCREFNRKMCVCVPELFGGAY